jgi:hypothetical protein
MELLAALVVARFRVRVAVDDLDRPLGILELHLLLITLVGHLLIAFSLAGRHAVVAQLLLLLLAELLHELLDLSALLGTVAPGVVHQTSQMTLVTIGGLSQLLVTAWATAPHQPLQAVGAPASDLLLLPPTFFFFFLFLFLSLL